MIDDDIAKTASAHIKDPIPLITTAIVVVLSIGRQQKEASHASVTYYLQLLITREAIRCVRISA
jgi:hypothetical protein